MMRCTFTWEAAVGWVRCLDTEGHGGRHENGLSWVVVGQERAFRHRWIGPSDG